MCFSPVHRKGPPIQSNCPDWHWHRWTSWSRNRWSRKPSDYFDKKTRTTDQGDKHILTAPATTTELMGWNLMLHKESHCSLMYAVRGFSPEMSCACWTPPQCQSGCTCMPSLQPCDSGVGRFGQVWAGLGRFGQVWAWTGYRTWIEQVCRTSTRRLILQGIWIHDSAGTMTAMVCVIATARSCQKSIQSYKTSGQAPAGQLSSTSGEGWPSTAHGGYCHEAFLGRGPLWDGSMRSMKVSLTEGSLGWIWLVWSLR